MWLKRNKKEENGARCIASMGENLESMSINQVMIHLPRLYSITARGSISLKISSWFFKKKKGSPMKNACIYKRGIKLVKVMSVHSLRSLVMHKKATRTTTTSKNLMSKNRYRYEF